MSFSSSLIAFFLIMLMYKALQIGEMQAKIRLNDFHQVITCVVIPGICAFIGINTVIQIWYYKPYENIFEDLLPMPFCQAILVLVALIMITNMLGARAGNIESYLSVNIYIALQLILSMLVVSQWALLFN